MKCYVRCLAESLAILFTCFAWSSPVPADQHDMDTSKFANATYHGIEDSPVQLSDGRWEGKPYVEGGASRPSVGLVENFVLTGDLDGDGSDESIVLLWQSSGGSGTFDHLAVMAEVGGELRNIATAPLGDRVQVRRAEISYGALYLEVIQAGEDDAACCPGQLAKRSWVLDPDGLSELDSEYLGDLSAATIEGDEWVLTGFGPDQPVPKEVKVTLQVMQGQVSGTSGCNRYSATLDNGAVPGEIKIGPAMSTRMACPELQMEIETRFLGLLGEVKSFQFLAGRLILSGTRDDTHFSLTFETDTVD